MTSLIKKHQRLPGSILAGIFQRFSNSKTPNGDVSSGEELSKRTNLLNGRCYVASSEDASHYLLRKKSNLKTTPLLSVHIDDDDDDVDAEVSLKEILGDNDNKMIDNKVNEENEIGTSVT